MLIIFKYLIVYNSNLFTKSINIITKKHNFLHNYNMAITIQNFLIYGQRCLHGTLLNLQKKKKKKKLQLQLYHIQAWK